MQLLSRGMALWGFVWFIGMFVLIDHRCLVIEFFQNFRYYTIVQVILTTLFALQPTLVFLKPSLATKTQPNEISLFMNHKPSRLEKR